MKIQKRQEIEFFGTKTGNANSIALGYATETKNFGEVAVGVMNKSTAAKDPNSPKGVCVDSDATLFSVGCGGSGERKNALEVKGDGSVLISGENGDINVADKIKQALDTNASIELVKSAESDLQYTLMVNNESRGSINIPKDQFLKNVTYDTEAKQLVFTFVTLDEEEHVEKISINDLKDVYTAGDGINIDNNVISADFSSVMTAISDEKTQRETTDNEIKSTLDTKADKDSTFIISGDELKTATFESDESSMEIGWSTLSSDGHGDPEWGISVASSFLSESSGVLDYVCLLSAIGITILDGDLNYSTFTPRGVRCAQLPQKDTEVLTTNGKSVDLTTYALKSALDVKADTSAIPTKVSQLTNDSDFATEKYVNDNIGTLKYGTITADLNSINGLFDSDTNRVRTGGANSVYIGFTDNADIDTDAMRSVFIGNINSYNTNYNICIGNSINVNEDRSVLIGNDISSSNVDNILIGNNISSSHMNSVIIGSGMTADVSDGYIGIGYDIKENTNAIYQIAGYGNPNIYNLEETLTYDNQHKKYIYGIGGYDGTNSDAEGIKSLQEVLTDKADASAYYTKTEIDGKGYLTAHQSLDAYAKQADLNELEHDMSNTLVTALINYARLTDIPNVSTKADLIDGKLKSEQLPKLDNIAAATTTEDMITKFNALLTDLKAKGYMTADITA